MTRRARRQNRRQTYGFGAWLGSPPLHNASARVAKRGGCSEVSYWGPRIVATFSSPWTAPPFATFTGPEVYRR